MKVATRSQAVACLCRALQSGLRAVAAPSAPALQRVLLLKGPSHLRCACN